MFLLECHIYHTFFLITKSKRYQHTSMYFLHTAEINDLTWYFLNGIIFIWFPLHHINMTCWCSYYSPKIWFYHCFPFSYKTLLMMHQNYLLEENLKSMEIIEFNCCFGKYFSWQCCQYSSLQTVKVHCRA